MQKGGVQIFETNKVLPMDPRYPLLVMKCSTSNRKIRRIEKATKNQKVAKTKYDGEDNVEGNDILLTRSQPALLGEYVEEDVEAV